MKRIKEITISSDNGKTVIAIDGEKLDLHDVVRVSIDIDCDGIQMTTEKSELLRLGDD